MASVLFPMVTSGFALGSIYALVAFGFVIILKSTDILSFTQLKIITIGAYVAYALITNNILTFYPALFVSTLVGFGLGVLLYFLVVKPMEGHPHFTIVVATIGVGIMLRPIVAYFWGYMERVMPMPFKEQPISFGFDGAVSLIHLAILFISLMLIFTFIIFFNTTLLGTQMRAVANDLETAHMMGVNVNRVFIISWGVAAMSASIAGVFLAGLVTVNPNLGEVGIKAFPVLILGGVDSISGVIIAGLIIGVIEVISGYFFGTQIRAAIVFAILLLILVIRPYGLFGERQVRRV